MELGWVPEANPSHWDWPQGSWIGSLVAGRKVWAVRLEREWIFCSTAARNSRVRMAFFQQRQKASSRAVFYGELCGSQLEKALFPSRFRWSIQDTFYSSWTLVCRREDWLLLGLGGGAAGLLQMQVPPGNTASAKANKAYACSPGRGCCQCPCTASKPQLIPSQSARVAAVDAFDYMV